MANQKAQPNAIQLTNLLNMQRDKSDTRPYDRFNANNAPLYGSTLSPFWVQKGDVSKPMCFDSHGNKWEWSFEGVIGQLTKNGSPALTLIDPNCNYGFKREYIDSTYVAYAEYRDGSNVLHKVHAKGGENSFTVFDNNNLIITDNSFHDKIVIKYYAEAGILVIATVSGRKTCVFFWNGSNSYKFSWDGTSSLPIVAWNHAEQANFVFVQNIPGIGLLTNKEVGDNTLEVRAFDVSGAVPAMYKAYFKDPDNTTHSYLVLLDDCSLMARKVTASSTPGNYRMEYAINSTAPTVVGTNITFSVDYAFSTIVYENDHTWNAEALKAGTILSPYTYRRTIKFSSDCITNGTWQHNKGYAPNYGYQERNNHYYMLAPWIDCMKQTVTSGYWSLAYNNGYVSGIGYCKNGYGALLTDWLNIDVNEYIYFYEDSFIYRDTVGRICKVSLTESPDWRVKIVNDIVIVNTCNLTNAINLKLSGENKFTWASMYNGELLPIFAPNEIAIKTELYDFTYVGAAAINPNYEQAPDKVPSAIFAPFVNVHFCAADDFTVQFAPSLPLNYIELYQANNATPKFVCYIFNNNGAFYAVQDFSKSDLTYPVDSTGNPLLSPSFFTEIIESGVKKDMLINGGSAYPLQYFDSVNPIYLYYLLSGVQGLQNVFILQGSVYGVTDENILLLSYSDSVVNSIDIIAIKKNMRYLGATPYTAYFWSDQNKSIYAFQGDRLLHKLYEANEIGEIYFTSYNSSTYTLYIATDKGIYAVGDCMYKIEINTAYKIEQTEKDVIVFYTDENGDKKYSKLRYDSAPGYERDKLHLCTSFFGAGVNVVSILDTWYMHFYNNGLEEDGEIKLRLETLTNTGRKTEEKTVKVRASDWDKLTNTYYFRYQPQYQRSIGASLDIVSDFPLRDLSVTSQADTLQVGGSI